MDTLTIKQKEEGYTYFSNKVNTLCEFSGDKGGRLQGSLFDIGTHIANKFNVFAPLFIVGYKLDSSTLFFEVWYLPKDGKYIVVDKFGKRTEKNQKFDKMVDAVDELVDVISANDERDDNDLTYYQELEDEIEDDAERGVRKKYKRSYRDFDNDKIKRTHKSPPIYDEYEESVEPTLNVKQLLEQSVASKAILFDLINKDIKEYKETRMNRNRVSSLWGLILGKNIKTPTKYLGGGSDSLFTLTGTKKEASFVIGYSLGNKIDIEIWFVKNVITSKGEFYVFDITAGQLIAKGMKTMRKAYAEIVDKIVLKDD